MLSSQVQVRTTTTTTTLNVLFSCLFGQEKKSFALFLSFVNHLIDNGQRLNRALWKIMIWGWALMSAKLFRPILYHCTPKKIDYKVEKTSYFLHPASPQVLILFKFCGTGWKLVFRGYLMAWMSSWWRVLLNFVLYHFCSPNNKKVSIKYPKQYLFNHLSYKNDKVQNFIVFFTRNSFMPSEIYKKTGCQPSCKTWTASRAISAYPESGFYFLTYI